MIVKYKHSAVMNYKYIPPQKLKEIKSYGNLPSGSALSDHRGNKSLSSLISSTTNLHPERKKQSSSKLWGQNHNNKSVYIRDEPSRSKPNLSRSKTQLNDQNQHPDGAPERLRTTEEQLKVQMLKNAKLTHQAKQLVAIIKAMEQEHRSKMKHSESTISQLRGLVDGLINQSAAKCLQCRRRVEETIPEDSDEEATSSGHSIPLSPDSSQWSPDFSL